MWGQFFSNKEVLPPLRSFLDSGLPGWNLGRCCVFTECDLLMLGVHYLWRAWLLGMTSTNQLCWSKDPQMGSWGFHWQAHWEPVKGTGVGTKPEVHTGSSLGMPEHLFHFDNLSRSSPENFLHSSSKQSCDSQAPLPASSISTGTTNKESKLSGGGEGVNLGPY